MNRINTILRNESYGNYLEKIQACEKERRFCRHHMTHFLDVCRLAEIEWLNSRLLLEPVSEPGSEAIKVKREEGFREWIYAAGLLHDIGRWQQYENNIPHELASAELAEEILADCGFEEWETKEIIRAILNHRNKEIQEENSLSGYLYRADKKSRPCFCCEVRQECGWPESKKNLFIV